MWSTSPTGGIHHEGDDRVFDGVHHTGPRPDDAMDLAPTQPIDITDLLTMGEDAR